MNRTPALALAALVLAAAPAPDALLGRILSDARQVDATSFAWERTIDATISGKHQVRVDRYDPRAPQPWTLLSVDGKPPSAGDLKTYTQLTRQSRPPNYGRVGEVLSAGARRIAPDRYQVDPLPASALDGRMAMFASRLTYEARVTGPADKPYVSEVRVYAAEPFRAKLVAKVEAFEAVSRYSPGPDGRPRIREQVVRVRGSAFGKSFDTDQTMRYRDL